MPLSAGSNGPSDAGDFVEFGSEGPSGRRRRWLGRLLLASLAAAAAAVVAWPSTHHPAVKPPLLVPAIRTIHGCYKGAGIQKNVYFSAGAATCPKGYLTISWIGQGPAGTNWKRTISASTAP